MLPGKRLGLLCLLMALLLEARMAAAEPLGRLQLPESVPLRHSAEPRYDITKPLQINSSWARPDARPLGVTLSSFDLTRGQIEAIEQIGCGLVRLTIPYESLQRDQQEGGAAGDWLALDQVVSRLQRAKLEVLPVITVSAVPDYRAFQSFCGNFARRYGRSFSHYQIFDNVNFQTGLPSQEYTDLLSAARVALLTSDPGARIVCGAIRGCDLSYLELLKANRAMPLIDVLAFNLFPPAQAIEGLPPLAGTAPSGSFGMDAHSLPYMEEILAWAQREGKPVWVTSLGVPTSQDIFEVGVDQVTQASIYARAALLLGHLGVERIIYAAIQDLDPEYARPALCCGLLDVTGAPKASFYALQALAGAVQGAGQVQPEFRVDSSVYARYSEAQMFDAARASGVEGADGLTAFQVHGLQVFGFWLYNPAAREYRMVYWLPSEPLNDHFLALLIYDERLKAVSSRGLLDAQALQLDDVRARNLISVPRQPLTFVPRVMTFEVRPDGNRG